MADLIFNSLHEDLSRGVIDFDADTFKALLVTSAYTPNKDSHDRRDDITNEVANGNGYTTGGATTSVTVARNNATDSTVITFGAVSWPSSTIEARRMIVYKARGGAASADELVFCKDFGSNVSTTGGTFSVAASTITIQN